FEPARRTNDAEELLVTDGGCGRVCWRWRGHRSEARSLEKSAIIGVSKTNGVGVNLAVEVNHDDTSNAPPDLAGHRFLCAGRIGGRHRPYRRAAAEVPASVPARRRNQAVRERADHHLGASGPTEGPVRPQTRARHR